MFGLKRFHLYLYGRHFTILIDNKLLEQMFGPKTSTPSLATMRLQRWAIILSAFNYSIIFVPSKPYAVADALSRLPLPSTFNEEDAFYRVEERLVHSLPITHKEINHAFKMGDETLFKKGYENLKSNYRPITVLVAFNNVFERILFMQLCDNFQDNLSPYPRIASIIAARLRFYVYLRNKPFNSQR